MHYVYILSSKRHGILYTGSTSDLIRRIYQHKQKHRPDGFSATYNVIHLVYYEVHDTYVSAAQREKRFKNWSRQWKINLIEQFNPAWRDLYDEVCQ